MGLQRAGTQQFPQMGGEAEAYHVHTRRGEPKFTKAGNPEMNLRFGPAIDLSNPISRTLAANAFAHSILTAPAHTVEAGKVWYPKVNEQVHEALQTRGFLSGAEDRELSGAGIFAAVSPGMDWDTANTHALRDVGKLTSTDWETIASGTDQEARDAVQGMSISRAPRTGLQKVGRIIAGEHPDDVIDRMTNPKTSSFMHNIHDPSAPFVTIDGRAFDMMTNRARPWEYSGRGIDKAMDPSGNPTRYEDASSIAMAVANRMGLDASAAQAISWSHGKYNMEQAGFTQRGDPRKQGPNRVGQPYWHPVTGEPAIHMDPRQFRGLGA